MRNGASHTGRALADTASARDRLAAASRLRVEDSTVATQRLPAPPREAIVVHKEREHNLRDVDVEIPRERFTVVTGVSGSGKSTLAFDIVFAEGQRRYLEPRRPQEHGRDADRGPPFPAAAVRQARRPTLPRLRGADRAAKPRCHRGAIAVGLRPRSKRRRRD